MTQEELRQAAIDCLASAFRGDTTIEVYVVQAAVSIVLALTPTAEGKP